VSISVNNAKHILETFGGRILRFDLFGLGDDDSGAGKNNQNGTGGQGNQNGGQNRQNLMMLLIAGMITLLGVSYFLRGTSSTEEEITYSEFVTMLEKEEVARVELGDGRIDIAPKTEGVADDSARIKYYTGKAEDDSQITQRSLDHGVIVTASTPDTTSIVVAFLVSYILPILLFWLLISFLFRRIGRSGGLMGGVGKSNAKEYVQRDTGVTFADVAGEDEAKESLQEVVDFLHNPGRYVQIGAKLPKGALLVGPPGTGKTLLAKAVAGEAHVPFFSLTGSDFIELYVGVGASRVRDLFREATKNAPCIIFIDEIDAIGRSRDSKYGGGNEEREQTLNQLLSEMDGFDSTKGILVLGATNRPEILDKALLRPGRFDRRIIVDRPDLKGRVAILKVHAKDVKLDETVDLDAIALATSGAVGSDLANMINEAAINAVKEHREYVNQKDLFGAVEQVLVGKEKKDRVMNEEERRIVSYHEVGHAMISAIQKNSEPVQKITIVPRTMGALGYVMQVPEEERYLNSKAQLHDMIVGLLGGRAAEELKFDSVTTGASNDIEKATSIARSMVTQYGMSDKFGLMGLATVESQYLEGRLALNCADVTAAAVDEEVRRIMEECYKEAKSLLADNLEIMDKIADYLIREETITGKQFMEIFQKAKEEKETGGASPAASAQTAGKLPEAGEQEQSPQLQPVQEEPAPIPDPEARAPQPSWNPTEDASIIDVMDSAVFADDEESLFADIDLDMDTAGDDDSVSAGDLSGKSKEPASPAPDEAGEPQKDHHESEQSEEKIREQGQTAQEHTDKPAGTRGRYSHITLDDIDKI